MAERAISWSRITFWTRFPILVVAVAVIVWQLFRLLPTFIEDSVGAGLLEKDIVLTAFPVEAVGLHGMQVGTGSLLVESGTVGWRSLWVGYALGDLMAGRIDHLFFDEPTVTIQLMPEPSAAIRWPAGLPLPLPPDAVPPRPGTVLEPPPPGAPPEAVAVAPSKSFRDQLLELPLNSVAGRDGVMEILFQETSLVRLSLDGKLESQPYGVSGELVLDNEWMAAELSLRAPASQRVVTIQADAVMPPGAFPAIQRKLAGIRPELGDFAQVASSGSFALSLFLELPSLLPPYGSVEASIEELALRFPFLDGELVLDRLLLAGTLLDGRVSLQGGAEVLPMQVDAFTADTFSMRFSARDSGDLALETEAIDWRYGDLAGCAALRGAAAMGDSAAPFSARLEASLAWLRLGDLRVDPFSLLSETDGQVLRLKGSPIGLVRAGTIWVEDLAADWNLSTQSGQGGLAWYNLSGKLMGTLAAELSQPAPDQWQAAFGLAGNSGERFLDGTFQQEGDRMELSARGSAPVDWINSLNKWWKVLPMVLSGPDPTLDVRLSGLYPFLAGTVDISLNGLGLTLDDGTLLEDIRGEISLLVNALPRAEEPQQLRIGRLTSGESVLEDIFVEWDMPHLRQLRIREFRGKLGDADIRTDPFEIDLLEPALETILHFERMEGNLLLEFLGEERFTLVGTVSGQLAVAWEADTLVIGKGSLAMDAAGQEARFLFTDQDFLKERFASFGAVPPDLKDLFLEALLQEGIRIETMEVTLGPAPEADKILLRLAISGESRTDRLEVPIRGFIINNLISGDDLAELIGLFGNVRFQAQP